jgi:predicted O-linked N-acetylglucosamine transferase (SPINDLY family)
MSEATTDRLAQARRCILSGQTLDATRICRAILQSEPLNHGALSLLGWAASASGNHAAAVEFTQQAISLSPETAEYYSHLSAYRAALGQNDQAEAAARQALAIHPQFAEAHYNLGLALNNQGRAAEAATEYRQALAINPGFIQALNNLGVVLGALCQLHEAEQVYRKGLALAPESPEIHMNLGQALQGLGHHAEAVQAYRQALLLRPTYDWAENNLGSALKEQGRVDEAIAAFRRALTITPGFAIAHSNLLMELHKLPGTTSAELAAAHAEWDQQHAAPLCSTWRPHDNSLDPERPLSLGFVSADFGRHPVGYFIVRLLEALDLRQCSLTCYSSRAIHDDLTDRLVAATNVWREMRGQSDEQLAAQIRRDQIDILFDLAGHTNSNRLLTFARKPAPIQISWFGYVGTTGLAAMDYVLADRFHAPPGAEAHYRERIIRMPDGYACYDPPAYAPPVAPLPAQGRGYVTFGSFNNLAKINERVLHLWSEVLRQVPGSRLLIKFRGLGDSETQQRYRELFQAAGGDNERLDLEGQSNHVEFLQAYERVDIALDPLPYSGGLTTCEALWMGVPVVTCPGETFASRHAFSHLNNAGFGGLVAPNFGDYVARAVDLVSDLPRLASLRLALRPQMARSPLCDGPRFAANFLEAMRTVFRSYVAKARASGGSTISAAR